ncbi:MFS transporter [Leekyejoonella antrihumi]|nr:MFS transporter [Leekyejoonella antrihumi]
MKTAFAIPAFRRLFVALAATMVADSVLMLTFGIWVKSLTGSSGAAGLTLFWVAVPSAVAPALGWVVDQFPRRAFLLAGYPLAAMSLLPLALVHGPDRVWIIYTVACAYGVALVMLPGAVTGLLKLIVPEETLVHANASTSSFREGMRLFGPLGGATLYAAFGMDAVVILVLCAYAVAVVAMLTLRVEGDAVQPPEMHWRMEFVAGLAHVHRDKVLWYPLLGIAGTIFAFGFIESLIYAIADAFGKPPTFVAVIVTVQGVGALAGGLTSGMIITRIGHIPAIVMSLFLFVISLAMMAAAPNILVILAGAIPVGFGLPVLVVSINTLIQVRTPNRLMARVSTTSDALVGIPQIIALAVGAGLVSIVPFRFMLTGMALIMLAIAVLLGLWACRPATHTLIATKLTPEKSPTAPEKSPTAPEKSQITPEKSPTAPEKSQITSEKRVVSTEP